MRGLDGFGVDVRARRPRHRGRRVSRRPRRVAVPAGRSGGALRRARAALARRATARPARPRRLGHRSGRRRRPSGARRRPARARRSPRPWTRASCARSYDDVERPLIGVLARMEKAGVGVDVAYLRELADGLESEVRRLEAEIQDAAGHPFTVNSTKQLRVGAVRRARPAAAEEDEDGLLDRRRRRSRSCAASTRSSSCCCATARSRSCDRPTARTCSPTWATTGASTPRSTRRWRAPAASAPTLPNLHNIPIRREEGRRFRRAFVPAPGHELLVADYNQIELRVIAHLAEDPGLIEAFTTHQDIHTTTAARVFGVDPADVDVEKRSKAKMVSYGLAYGMESYGLGQRLGDPDRGGGDHPRRVLRGVPECEGLHGPRRRRGARPRATPRPCSAGAASSPSSRHPTTGFGRPASARR